MKWAAARRTKNQSDPGDTGDGTETPSRIRATEGFVASVTVAIFDGAIPNTNSGQNGIGLVLPPGGR